MNAKQLKTVRDYIDQEAAAADKNSKAWDAAGDLVNAAYRSGMWYAYNDVRNRLAVGKSKRLN